MECSNSSLGDNFCDQECMTPDCNYDTGPATSSNAADPSNYFEQYSDCWSGCSAAGCQSGAVGDGVWTHQWNIPECGYDLGDCTVCSTDCSASKLGDGTCDVACNTYKCNLDNGDCGFCSNVPGNTCDSAKLDNGTWDNECMSNHCDFDKNACGGNTSDNPAVVYVSASSVLDSTPRAGTITDPYRSLTGAMASLSSKYTVIKLLDTHHYLSNFNPSAFPDSLENADPKNPFQDLAEHREIIQMIVKPEFCSNSSNIVQCVPDDTYVTLELPNTQLTFDFGFAVEFHWVIFDGQNQLALPNTRCYGQFCTYCPDVSIENGKVYGDYGDPLTLPYRNHCADWHDTDLFKVSDSSGSLYLDNVQFVEIRAQYRRLIYMYNSSNLTLLNTRFTRVQTRPQALMSVVTIEDDGMTCPTTGCATIILNNWQVKFMNYGYNLTSRLQLSSFISMTAEKVSLSISQSSFDYNIATGSALLDLSQLKQITLEHWSFRFNIGGAQPSAILINPSLKEVPDEDMTHISIQNCEFNRNGSTDGVGVMSIQFLQGRDLYNILLQGNVFTHNSSQQKYPVVEIVNRNDEITASQLEGRQKRSLMMQNNTFEDNGSHGNGVVVIQNMPNVKIQDDNVFSSNTDIVDFNTKVLSNFINNGYYQKEFITSEEYLECMATLSLFQCINVEISHLKIENNSCDCTLMTTSWVTAGLQGRVIEGNLSVQNIDITGNTCKNWYTSGLYFVDSLQTEILMSDMTFTENLVTGNYAIGTIALRELSTNFVMFLAISDSSFIDNTATGGSAIYSSSAINIALINVTIIGNTTSEQDGCLVLRNHQVSNILFITIRNGYFSENITQAGYGGIYVQNLSTTAGAETRFQMDDTVISGNKAKQGAAIYLRTGPLSNDCYIRNSKFENNDSEERGAVYLAFDAGIMEIADNSFENNQGVESCICISTNANTDLIPSYTKIQNNTYKGNKGIIISLLENIQIGNLKLEQNVFSQNSGSAMVIRHGNVTDSDSIYENHISESGAGVTIMKDSIYTGTEITFNQNEANTWGGAVFTTTQSSFICSSCTFTNNKAQKGGAVYVESSSRVEISQSIFHRNIATDIGSAYYMSNSQTDPRSSIKMSDFTYNEVQNFGTIFLVEASMELDSILLENNETQSQTSGIVLNMSQIILSKSKISRQYGLNGGCIHATQHSDASISDTSFDSVDVDEKGAVVFALDSSVYLSQATITNAQANQGAALFISYGSTLEVDMSIFGNLHSLNSGGIFLLTADAKIEASTFINCTSILAGAGIYADEGHLSMNDTLMKYMNAGIAAAIFAQGQSDLDITNSQFLNCNSNRDGQVTLMYKSSLKMHSSTFDEFIGSAIVGVDANIELYDVNIWNGTSLNDTSPVDCDDWLGFSVIESRFYNNTSTQRGAISAYTEDGNPIYSKFIVASSQFMNNTAENAGAMYVSNHNMEIRDWIFESNRATAGYGGSLQLDCPDYDFCEYDVYGNQFTHNTANISGGAIKWDDREPYNLTENVYSNNSALYGSDSASFPVALAMIDHSKRELEARENMIYGIASGQPANVTLHVALVDHIGQVITSDSTSRLYMLSTDSSVTLQGLVIYQASNGVFTVDDWQVTAKPNSNATIRLWSPDVENSKAAKAQDDTTFNEQITQVIELRHCLPGEVLLPSYACYPCDKNQYSLEAEADKWKDCPSEAVWLGGINVFPKENYWRSGWDSEHFHRCRLLDVCLGGEEQQNYSGQWEKGYKGRICTVCEDNWARLGTYGCTLCFDSVYLYFLLIITSIAFLFLFALYVLQQNVKSAERGIRTVQSVLLRIATNHLTLITLVNSLRMEWPDFVLEYYDSQDKVGSSSEIAINLDCLIDRNIIQPVYANLIAVSALPIILTILTIAIWTLIKLCLRRKITWAVTRHYGKGTLINILFLVHPTILKSCMQIFTCNYIDDKWYLEIQMEEECWTGDHQKFIRSVAVPSFLIWGIGLPVIAFSTIAQRHSIGTLYQRKRMEAYGFLYLGYTRKKYWWEVVILFRKIFILANLILLNQISTFIQALSAIAFLWFAIQLQNNNSPYMKRIINRIEIVSLNVSMMTCYAGLWYQKGEIGQEASIILFVLILSANLAFGIMWVNSYIKQTLTERGLRFEKYYCKKQCLIPSFFEGIYDDEVVPYNKRDFLSGVLLGNYLYSYNFTEANMHELLKQKKYLMRELLKEVQNNPGNTYAKLKSNSDGEIITFKPSKDWEEDESRTYSPIVDEFDLATRIPRIYNHDTSIDSDLFASESNNSIRVPRTHPNNSSSASIMSQMSINEEIDSKRSMVRVQNNTFTYKASMLSDTEDRTMFMKTPFSK